MTTDLDTLRSRWEACWPDALAAWSSFTKLHRPTWCFSAEDEKREGLSASFAMIRLVDHTVVISLRQVAEYGLEDFATEVLAHEIGHHVYTPADLEDNARLLACIRAALPSCESYASLIANLYSDLLLNDRLQRDAGLDMTGVYEAIVDHDGSPTDKLWRMYLRTYEVLWNLPSQTLVHGEVSSSVNLDATLGARLIRAYGKHWLEGGGRFAALCLSYLLERSDQQGVGAWGVVLDTQQAGQGEAVPDGMAAIRDIERDGAVHPHDDPDLSGVAAQPDEESSAAERPGPGGQRARVGGQKNEYRSPSGYIELMESLGVEVDENELLIRYYKELARPHLIEFPTREMPAGSDPLPEGVEPWDLAAPVSRIDWMQSVIRSPQIIPGVTTVQRTYGTTAGFQPDKQPVDVYLGIDCSGSMSNPRYRLSYPVVAGTVITLSALRAGAKVMTCLSGEPGEYTSTEGFERNERANLGVLTSYLGTGYAFGILRLKEAFMDAERRDRPCHILVVTDSDLFQMLAEVKDGWGIAHSAAQTAGGGATCVLDMASPGRYADGVARLRDIGWNVHFVNSEEGLVDFAREFSKMKYGE